MSDETTNSPQRPSADRAPADARQATTRRSDRVDGTQIARRSRHKAIGGRVLATGIGAGALFGLAGAIGAHAGPPKPAARRVASQPAPLLVPTRPTPTTIVWRVVHRTIVVTDPPVVTSSSGGATSSGQPASPTYSPANAVSAAPPTPAPVVAASPAPAPVVAPAPAPAPAPAVPACSGSKCP